jgi:hypothetical protein
MTSENGGTGNAFEEVDIFKMEPAGVLWRGVCSNLEGAKIRIKKLLVSDPGEYFIHTQSTGNKIFFKPKGPNGHNGAQ